MFKQIVDNNHTQRKYLFHNNKRVRALRIRPPAFQQISHGSENKNRVTLLVNFEIYMEEHA